MDDRFLALLSRAPLAQPGAELARSLRAAQAHGLALSQAQLERLERSRLQDLRATGRVEFGGGILPKLLVCFCSSPYLSSGCEADLAQLQTLFYQFKGECGEQLTDDELLSAMRLIFDQAARGDLEFLAAARREDLYRAARTGSLAGTAFEEEALYDWEE